MCFDIICHALEGEEHHTMICYNGVFTKEVMLTIGGVDSRSCVPL